MAGKRLKKHFDEEAGGVFIGKEWNFAYFVCEIFRRERDDAQRETNLKMPSAAA